MTPKEELIRVLEIRQELGKSAVKKYDTVVKMRCEDGKIRGMMGFYGANRTGRYCFAAGTLVQSQENGLVPIESISSEDLVWDGNDFVSCDGAVCNGFRPVGLLEGICVTPDHLLKKSFGTHRWTRADEYKGFEMLPECALVYDIRDCGKNHCYAVYSENERQQFVAHNCSHGVQLQNLKRTHVPSLNFSRSLVKDENEPALRLCYGNVADTLGQLVRTALVPSPGNKFFDADYAQVEARVIAWLAGENWRLELFRDGGDIYCESASKIYGVPVKKGGVNGDLRQRGKVAELACIAEGTLVKTSKGYKPIQEITQWDDIWDGWDWVRCSGAIYRGKKPCGNLRGVRMTPDHLCYGYNGNPNCNLWNPAESFTDFEAPKSDKDTLPVWDLQNCGDRHCYSVYSPELKADIIVHNCGYGGGVGAMRRMDTVHALDDKPDEEVKTIVDQWRVASPNIINLWHDLESAAMNSVRYGTENTVVKPNCKIIFRGETDGKRRFLTVELPSGRKLFYPEPKIGTNRFGSESITYMGQNQLSKKWERVDTYGGKLTENITQAVARDLLCHSIELLESNGFPVVFSIHDEVVVDYPDGGSDEANEKILEKIVEVMRILPDWAKGCPIDADGWYDDYFRKE